MNILLYILCFLPLILYLLLCYAHNVSTNRIEKDITLLKKEMEALRKSVSDSIISEAIISYTTDHDNLRADLRSVRSEWESYKKQMTEHIERQKDIPMHTQILSQILSQIQADKQDLSQMLSQMQEQMKTMCSQSEIRIASTIESAITSGTNEEQKNLAVCSIIMKSFNSSYSISSKPDLYILYEYAYRIMPLECHSPAMHILKNYSVYLCFKSCLQFACGCFDLSLLEIINKCIAMGHTFLEKLIPDKGCPDKGWGELFEYDALLIKSVPISVASITSLKLDDNKYHILLEFCKKLLDLNRLDLHIS